MEERKVQTSRLAVERSKPEHGDLADLSLDRDPLHFIKRDFIAGAIVQLRCPR
jgi:hypothetical protein